MTDCTFNFHCRTVLKVILYGHCNWVGSVFTQRTVCVVRLNESLVVIILVK